MSYKEYLSEAKSPLKNEKKVSKSYVAVTTVSKGSSPYDVKKGRELGTARTKAGATQPKNLTVVQGMGSSISFEPNEVDVYEKVTTTSITYKKV